MKYAFYNLHSSSNKGKRCYIDGPEREKTYLLTCASNKDSNQIAHPRSLIRVFVVRMKKLCFLTIKNAPNENSDETTNAHADLNLHWVHMSEVRFVTLWLVRLWIDQCLLTMTSHGEYWNLHVKHGKPVLHDYGQWIFIELYCLCLLYLPWVIGQTGLSKQSGSTLFVPQPAVLDTSKRSEMDNFNFRRSSGSWRKLGADSEGSSGVQSNPSLTHNFIFMGHFDKFGTLYLVLLFNKSILLPVNVCEIAGWVENSVDPDQTPRSAASGLGLLFLLMPVCPNTRGKCGSMIKSNPSVLLDTPLKLQYH